MTAPTAHARLAEALAGIEGLGPLLRAARLEAGLTQAQLAARVGVQQSHVARWELGIVSPAPERIKSLLAALSS